MTVALIVDDDEPTVRLFRHVLEKVGIASLIATTAEDAIRQLVDVQPDVLLLDLKLPHQPGTAVIDYLLAENRLHRLRLIVISATAPDLYMAGYSVPYKYLQKPLMPHQLREVLQTEL